MTDGNTVGLVKSFRGGLAAPGKTRIVIEVTQPVVVDSSKIEKTAAGKETIDGHPCVKNKIVVTDAKGKKTEGFVWNASDLKDFPIQVEVHSDKTVTTIHYTEPKFEKPEAKLFDTPAGYTKYASMQQMMQAAMMKMMGGGK